MNTLSSVYPKYQSIKGQKDLPFPPAPRTSITGAQISAHAFKVDWLEFTVKAVGPSDAIHCYLGLDRSVFTVAEHGMQGYPDLEEYGTVKVLYHAERPERGTKVILSGQALDEVGNDALYIIRQVLRDGGTFARVDIALDERMGLLDLEEIEGFVDAGYCVTHFAIFEPRKPRDLKKKCLTGYGLYWGSRHSGRMVRLYDKRLERIHKFKEDDPGHWVRLELESRKRSALAVATRLATDGIDAIPGILRGAVDFRDLESNENSTRRESLPWWDQFFKGAEKIKTGFKKPVATIADKALWLSHACKKAMGMVFLAFGPDAFKRLLSDGVLSIAEKDMQIMQLPGAVETGMYQFIDEVYGQIAPCADIPF